MTTGRINQIVSKCTIGCTFLNNSRIINNIRILVYSNT
jgi:hypothetical protein